MARLHPSRLRQNFLSAGSEKEKNKGQESRENKNGQKNFGVGSTSHIFLYVLSFISMSIFCIFKRSVILPEWRVNPDAQDDSASVHVRRGKRYIKEP